MKPLFLNAAIALAGCLLASAAQGGTNALTLTKIIPLPDVRGRIDHFAADGSRLFLAALGNDTVEVLDVESGRRLRTIGGCSEPQGVAFAPKEDRLLIANGGSGRVTILDGTTFGTVREIDHLEDADNARYLDGCFYVGYGNGAVAMIRAATGELLGTVPLDGHPESFQLEKNGRRIFVNVPDAGQVAVIDRDRRRVIAVWPMPFHGNFPMALDEAHHRLFIGCRDPARLLVLDTNSGKRIGAAQISGDTDDVFYDAKRNRVYVSCGAGVVDVLDGGNYGLCERVTTATGARTSFCSPERGELYVAVRAGMISGRAEVRVFRCD